ncbi:hypothetical protein [Streptomyces collinus]
MTWEQHFTTARPDMRRTARTFAAHGPERQGEMTLDHLYREPLEDRPR